MELSKVIIFIEGDKPAILLDVNSNMLINFHEFFWFQFHKENLEKPKEVELNYNMSLGDFGERHYVKIVFNNMPIEIVEKLAMYLAIDLKFYEKDKN